MRNFILQETYIGSAVRSRHKYKQIQLIYYDAKNIFILVFVPLDRKDDFYYADLLASTVIIFLSQAKVFYKLLVSDARSVLINVFLPLLSFVLVYHIANKTFEFFRTSTDKKRVSIILFSLTPFYFFIKCFSLYERNLPCYICLIVYYTTYILFVLQNNVFLFILLFLINIVFKILSL